MEGADLLFRMRRREAAAGEERLVPAGGDRAEGDGVDADAPQPVVDGKGTGQAQAINRPSPGSG
jgi:hypothetical protein